MTLPQNKASESISAIDNEIAEIESKVLVEYTNYRSGIISKEEFISRREKLSDEVYALNLQKEKSNAYLKIPDSVAEAKKTFKDFIVDESVSNELISKLVNKIYISSDKKIEIDWNFKDIFDISI